MANESVARVRAIDIATNRVVECDESETVGISVIPQTTNPYGGDGSPIVPGMIRALRKGGKALVLLSIEPSQFNRSRPWPFARFATEPYQVSNGFGKVLRETDSCYIRDERDIIDPWLSKLSDIDRDTLRSAVAKYKAEFAERAGGAA